MRCLTFSAPAEKGGEKAQEGETVGDKSGAVLPGGPKKGKPLLGDSRGKPFEMCAFISYCA
jgi:hypothetical protein